jgi:hypothetical protein
MARVRPNSSRSRSDGFGAGPFIQAARPGVGGERPNEWAGDRSAGR